MSAKSKAGDLTISRLHRWRAERIIKRRARIVDEQTGKTVAMTDSAAKAEQIARLPELIEALEQAWYAIIELEADMPHDVDEALKACMEMAWSMEDALHGRADDESESEDDER